MSTFSEFLENHKPESSLNEAERNWGAKAVAKLIASNQQVGKKAIDSYGKVTDNTVVLEANPKMTSFALKLNNSGNIIIFTYHSNGIGEKTEITQKSLDMINKL